MGTILLVESDPDLGLLEAGLLEDLGHRVLRCSGAPTPLGACLMLRSGACPLPAAAEMIIFNAPPAVPMRGRSYTGASILRAYRSHPRYGRLPMLVVDMAPPKDLPGAGRIGFVPTFSSPRTVVRAVEGLLASASSSARTSR